MNRKLKALVLAPAAALALVVGAQIAQADTGAEEKSVEKGNETPEDDAGEEDEQVTGAARNDAAAAAIEASGGGTVTEVEIADEGDSGYEVEVQNDDGTFVEVALDTDFGVVSVEEDDD